MASPSKRVRRAPWRPIAVILVTTICAFVLAEIGYRVWRSAHDWPYDGVEMRDAFQQARNFATQKIPLPADAIDGGERRDGRWVLDPFVGFDLDVADRHLEGELTAAERRSANDVDVLVLGGSVAGIFAALGEDAFVRTLREDARFRERNVRFSNHARGGYKQPQQASELVFLLAVGYRPSAVINIDGFNEVALANDNAANGMHPLYPSHTHWLHLIGAGASDPEASALMEETRDAQQRIVRLADFGLEFGLWRSSVFGTLVQRGLRRSVSARGEAQIAYGKRLMQLSVSEGVTGPPIHGGRESALAVSVEGWAQSSLCIQAMCAARGIPYLHVLQPTLHDEGAKFATSEELETGLAPPGWIESVRAGYPMLRARGELLRGEGVPFVDASRIFADVHETLYYDVCHFGKAGNDRLARFVAETFLDHLPMSQR